MHVSAAFCIFLVLHLAAASAVTYPDVADVVDRAKPARGPNFSLYNFQMNDARGKPVDFKQFQGKVS